MVSHFCYRMISFHNIGYKQEKTKDLEISIQHHAPAFLANDEQYVQDIPNTRLRAFLIMLYTHCTSCIKMFKQFNFTCT